METTYLTITIKPKYRPRKKHRSCWTIYARLFVLALAATMTARLVLLMMDVIQAGGNAPDIVAVPLYAVWLIFTGWKLRKWSAGSIQKEEICYTENAHTAELTLIPGKPAIVDREGTTR